MLGWSLLLDDLLLLVLLRILAKVEDWQVAHRVHKCLERLVESVKHGHLVSLKVLPHRTGLVWRKHGLDGVTRVLDNCRIVTDDTQYFIIFL